MASPSSEAAIAAAQSLMDRRARVRLSDGRVLLGRLTCLDWQGNLLLSDAAIEAANGGGSGGGSSGAGASAGAEDEARGHIGVAVVPAQFLVSCEVLAENAAAVAAASIPPP